MAKSAILLLNLGSPESTAIPDVRRYLREFLGDERVLDTPAPIRWMALNLFILPFRPKRTARAYRRIWSPDGSPLIAISRRVQAALSARAGLPVYLSMRYGRPSAAAVAAQIKADGIGDLLLFPQYPHYAMASWETAVVRMTEELRRQAPALRVTTVQPFYGDADYIEALCASARPQLEKPWDHLLFSYHGLPVRHMRKADSSHAHCLTAPDCCATCSPAHATCYRAQCLQTTRAFVHRAGLDPEKFSLSFQSRLAGEPWLEPYTDFEFKRLAQAGKKRLLVIMPAFMADCLETLEEIALTGRDSFLAAGGAEFTAIPCLNDQPACLDFLAGRVRRWLESRA